MHRFFKHWKNDLSSGIVVFLVAIPLCLGIALASGAPLFAGIIAGIVGGVVVTLISDSSLGVSGPAAGLVAIVALGIQDLGFEVFLVAVALAGVIQFVLGLLKCGIIGYYFPTSVIKGMLVAIGLIIILKQIPHAVGYDRDFEGDLAFKQPDGHNTFSEIFSISSVSFNATAISLTCLAILILWEQKFIKRIKLFQIIQGPLVAVTVGVLLHLLFRGGQHAFRPEQLVSLPVAETFSSFLTQFTRPDFRGLAMPAVYVTAATLAIVASLESLLCAEATDKLDPQKRTTNLNRELLAQGTGNFLSGLLGGLPVTQVIVRSSTNIQSGGKTRAAAFFHGVLLLVCVALIPGILNLIPLAALAAILIVVGFKLAHPTKFKEEFARGWDQFMPFITTIAAIMLTDLLVGITIGFAVSLFFILREHYRHAYWLHEEPMEKGRRIRLVLSENVSFLNKGSILRTLRDIPDHSEVVIDGSHSVHIDHDVRDLLVDFAEGARYKEIRLEMRLSYEKNWEHSQKDKSKPEEPASRERVHV